MIWNHLLHIFFGYIGRDMLTLSQQGVLICFSITALIQGIDTIRFYSYTTKRLISERPESLYNGRLEAVKKDAAYKLLQLWFVKIVWYGSVSMLAAAIFR